MPIFRVFRYISDISCHLWGEVVLSWGVNSRELEGRLLLVNSGFKGVGHLETVTKSVFAFAAFLYMVLTSNKVILHV